jgi:acetylornithine deacetylase/succinyl-diaminopimelate desuccinylase-like protein
VHGGTKSNVIPGSCDLTVDTRWIPRHSTVFVKDQLAALVDSLAAKDQKFSASVELMYDAPSLSIPATHPVVRLAESLSGAVSEVARYGTEAALYSTKGVPSIVLGPGSVEQAHTVDEYVEVRQLRRAESLYSKMISSVCT